MKSYLLSGKMLGNLVVLALLGLWFVTLGPTVFKGPAGYIEVSGHSMDGTYRTGDLILTRKHDTYAVGDIITFQVPNGDAMGQVIHRITGGNGTTGYTTQGDNNPDPDPWHPTDADVVGKAWHRFEGKAWLMHLPQRPWFVGAAAGVLTLVMLGLDAIPSRRKRESEENVLVPVLSAAGSETTLHVPAQRADSVPAPRPTTWRNRLKAAPDTEDASTEDESFQPEGRS